MVRVLVVDDEPTVVRAFRRVLAASGFDVATSTSGPAALTLLDTWAADAVLSDYQMPGMSGVGLLCEVRRRWPTVRRVLMSAAVENIPAEQVATCEPHVVLAKPCSHDALVSAVCVL